MGVNIDCKTGAETQIPDAYSNAPPDVVTRYQFKAAIRASGQASNLLTYINGLTAAGKEEWTDRRVFRRDSPLIAAAATALGFNANQVDNLFRSALAFDD